MHRLLPILVMVLVYLALSASVGISNVAIGLIIALGAYGLIHPEKLSVNWRSIPSAFVALIKYITALAVSVVRSGFQITRIVLDPSLPIKTGIIAVPPECDSEIGRALGAHAISLPPGELLIEMDEDGTMYIHSLDILETEKYIRSSQARRRGLMRKIFDQD